MKLEDILKNPIEKIFEMQKSCYPQKLLLTDTVKKDSRSLGKLSVSNYGHFFCEYITVIYQTLTDTGTDDGVCRLRGKLQDGAQSRYLFDDYIPLNLFGTPGRVKKAGVSSTEPANGLFYPLYFPYLFGINGDILFEVLNDGGADTQYSLCFHGYRIQK